MVEAPEVERLGVPFSPMSPVLSANPRTRSGVLSKCNSSPN